MINDQLKKQKKKGLWLREKTHLEKKIGSQQGFAGLPGSRVNLTSQSGFVGFLLILVF